MVCSGNKVKFAGKEFILSENEMEELEQFFSDRISFVCLDENTLESDISSWEPDGVLKEEYEYLVRGYIKPDRIVFYMTSNFIPIPKITKDLINLIKPLVLDYFGPGKYHLWNGVFIGKYGKEWAPLEIYEDICIE